MPYKHGVYGESIPSKAQVSPENVGTLPVYIGIAPVGQLANYSNAVNKPILVGSFEEAKAAVGYNDDFAGYTLCEAIDAHFRTNLGAIGPIVLINVLDPAMHKTEDQTANPSITYGRGIINNKNVILNSIAITGKTLGTDYRAYYTDDGSQVIIEEIVSGSLGASAAVTFDETDPEAILADDIIGKYDPETEERTGLFCIDLIYQLFNAIPTILLAPGWSNTPTIDAALKTKCQKINGHWDCTVFSDLDAGTVALIQTWKNTNGYISKLEKVFWPCVKKGTKIYHLSTLAAVTKQRLDYENSNVPFESPSNKQLDITALCLEDGTAITFDEKQANVLNSRGITTVNFSGGKWVLWGPHMANYEYGVTAAADEIFDASIFMMQYLNNDFQIRNPGVVDSPIDRRDIDYILNVEQLRLNALITDGRLLYGKIEFRPSSNPSNDLIQGDFVFDTSVTYTPPGKSLTQKLQYTDAGIASLTGGEG